MRHIVKEILTFLLLSAAWSVNAQQISNPALNIPVNDSPGAGLSVAYPLLNNITGVNTFNLIRTTTPDQPVQNLPLASNVKYRQRADYFDGLGRPLQSVDRKAHADGYDIVQHHVYDKLGREKYNYLPFAVPNSVLTTTGSIKTAAYTHMRNFYDAAGGDEQPYSLKEYDDADQGKVVKQSQPGRAWVGSNRGSQYYYTHNITNEVLLWKIGPAENDLPETKAYYEAGSLYVTQVTDEDGKKALEYKDKDGLLILKKVLLVDGHINPLLHINYACTYYVYDDQKRLRFVIPPKAVSAIDNGAWDVSTVPELCFSYDYDERGRLIKKKIPGKEPEEFVYDKRDRLIFTRDGNLKGQSKWAFTLYDAIDRPITNGLIGYTHSREALQNFAKDESLQYQFPAPHVWGYINNFNLLYVYPAQINATTILSYTYYDNYDQIPSGYEYVDSLLTHYLPAPLPAELDYPVRTQVTRGLVTGTKVRVTDPQNPSVDQWIIAANYYDNKGRLLQTRSNDHWGGSNINSQVYYFQGMPFKNIDCYENASAKAVPHANDGPTSKYVVETTYSRNLVNGGGNSQVWKIDQVINGGPIFNIANYDYDHLGRVTIKDFQGGLIKQDYNMRGFLTSIDVESHNALPYKPIFEERIRYDWGFENKFYNGNIAGIVWRGSDNAPHAYGYSYDKLDRLIHAEYRYQDTTPWIKTLRDYTASNIQYDLNGNIIHMDQQGGHYPGTPKKMDVLTYQYEQNTNKLKAVEDNGDVVSGLPDFKDGATSNDEYGYDANGNMTRDDNKKILSISYNYLNKPEIITTDSGSIYYVYDGTGNLLQKRISKGGSVEKYDYSGKIVFLDSVPQYILNEEGRVRPVASDTTGNYTRYVYDYFIKDHLGNVRSTVTANPINSGYMALHEIATANLEQLVFDNIPSVRETKPGSSNPNDGMAAHLIASDPDQRVGTAIMLRVMPGDKFSLSANTYYEGDYNEREETGSGPALESLLSALMGGGTYAGVPVSELPENIQTVQGIFANPALASRVADLQAINDDPTVPKAHLNYLFFNDNFELQPALSGAIQVGPSIGGGWQSTGNHNACNCTATAPAGSGFVIIYIDNQSIGKDVWFDNIHVEHYTSSVLEESHYYPFGLTVGVGQAAQTNLPKQPYKYQGIELEKHFGLEMYETANRGLDPQLGRFMQVDPKADSTFEFSPYVSMNNNPVRYVDPEGDFAFLIPFIPIIVDAAVLATASVVTYLTVDNVVDQMKAKQQAREASSSSSGGSQAQQQSQSKKGEEANPHETSKAARKDVMRKEGIPTSQQPKSQTNTKAGKVYEYETSTSGGGKTAKQVQQQTKDEGHGPHWEAGKTKPGGQKDGIGRDRLSNGKSKSFYKK